MERYCGLDFCSRLYYVKDLCQFHYDQQRLGKPFSVPTPRRKPGEPRGACGFSGCQVGAELKGFCRTHYHQQYRGEEMRSYEPRPPGGPFPCAFDGCGKMARVFGYCVQHGDQIKRGIPLRPIKKVNQVRQPCGFPGCRHLSNNRGLCVSHARQRDRGEDVRELEFRSPIGEWGTPHRNQNGYMVETRRVDGKRYNRLVHRAVMERMIGRPLRPEESVHHVNGKRDDNRETNLELWPSRHGKGQRVEDLIAWILTDYPEFVARALPDYPDVVASIQQTPQATPAPGAVDERHPNGPVQQVGRGG